MPSAPLDVPFFAAAFGAAEREAVGRALDGGLIPRPQAASTQAGALLERLTGAARVLLTPSCTAALELAAHLLDLAPGDEVVMPSFTFSSTANAVVLRGARPVFVDIEPATLCLDLDDVERVIGPRTRAVLPVHYNGWSCDMGRLAAMAEAHGLAVIEDAAQAVAAEYRGQPLGTFGRLGCYSFHHTKTFSAGEGGALVVMDPADVRRAEILHEKGTNRSAFLRGDIDKYTWVDVGSSYVMGELNAAVLCGQLAGRAAIVAARRRLHEAYDAGLHELYSGGRLDGPTIPDGVDPNYHLYFVVFRTALEATSFRAFAKTRGVGTAFHYVPLHTSPMGRRLAEPRDLPVTDSVAWRLVRLPFYPSLTADAQARVIDTVWSFCRAGQARPRALACA